MVGTRRGQMSGKKLQRRTGTQGVVGAVRRGLGLTEEDVRGTHKRKGKRKGEGGGARAGSPRGPWIR